MCLFYNEIAEYNYNSYSLQVAKFIKHPFLPTYLGWGWGILPCFPKWIVEAYKIFIAFLRIIILLVCLISGEENKNQKFSRDLTF